jgi:SAM-dependent methyltransferase
MSIQYYNDHAQDFFDSTHAVNLSPILQRFIAGLSPQAHILDAGCGSGRDSKTFLGLGYRVTAFDASAALAQLASQHMGQLVAVATFDSFATEHLFDGIWACASLLHVPAHHLPATFFKLSQMLAPDGRFYCSFKYGDGVGERDGRYFTNGNEARLARWIDGTGLTIAEIWQTADARPGRETERWLNAILVRIPHNEP